MLLIKVEKKKCCLHILHWATESEKYIILTLFYDQNYVNLSNFKFHPQCHTKSSFFFKSPVYSNNFQKQCSLPSSSYIIPSFFTLNRNITIYKLMHISSNRSPWHGRWHFVGEATLNRYQNISRPGHLGTEHMRHLGTRYWTSRYWKFRYWIIKIIWLNLKTLKKMFYM